MTIREKAAYVKGLVEGLNLDEDKKETKELTYIEQIEAQRNSVKSQILNHL